MTYLLDEVEDTDKTLKALALTIQIRGGYIKMDEMLDLVASFSRKMAGRLRRSRGSQSSGPDSRDRVGSLNALRRPENQSPSCLCILSVR